MQPPEFTPRRLSLLLGYAWAHVGNARRVASDLPSAEAAFRRAWTLWEAGSAADSGLLDGSRLLDLEASLLRDQRKMAAALESPATCAARSTIRSCGSRRRPRTGRARVVGITGPPGAGKSTLVDRFAHHCRRRGTGMPRTVEAFLRGCDRLQLSVSERPCFTA